MNKFCGATTVCAHKIHSPCTAHTLCGKSVCKIYIWGDANFIINYLHLIQFIHSVAINHRVDGGGAPFIAALSDYLLATRSHSHSLAWYTHLSTDRSTNCIIVCLPVFSWTAPMETQRYTIVRTPSFQQIAHVFTIHDDRRCNIYFSKKCMSEIYLGMFTLLLCPVL